MGSVFDTYKVSQVGSTFAKAPGTAVPAEAALVEGRDSAGNGQVLVVDTFGDGVNNSLKAILVRANMAGFNGGTYDALRVANVYKTVEQGGLAATTSLTVWTPGAVKKIRLMGAIILAGSAGQMKLRMGTAGAGANVVTVGGAAGDTYYVNFGQGKLATNANDVLEVFNNNAGATSVWVTAWGTEE